MTVAGEIQNDGEPSIATLWTSAQTHLPPNWATAGVVAYGRTEDGLVLARSEPKSQ